MVVDEERAALFGLTTAQVSAFLRNAFGGAPVAMTRDGKEEVELMVELDLVDRQDPSGLGDLMLIAPRAAVNLLETVTRRSCEGFVCY